MAQAPAVQEPVASGAKRSRTWMGTLHCEMDVDTYLNLKKPDWEENTGLKYAVFGVERGSRNGRRHFQVFAAFKNPVALAGIKAVFDIEYLVFEEDPESPMFGEAVGEANYKGAYYACRGTISQNYAYATKDGQFYEYGERPQDQAPGSRSDIEAVKELVKAGSSYVDIVDQYPSAMRYAAGLDKYAKALNNEKAQALGFQKKQVTILFGETGSGKTRAATSGLDPKDIFIWSSAMGRNFDGYECQKRIVIDEFVGDLPITFMNRLLDGNPFQVNVKYSSRWIVATEIIITSNRRPLYWWNRTNHSLEQREAVFRRVDRVVQKDIASETEIAVGESVVNGSGESVYVGCLNWYRAAEAMDPPIVNAPASHPFVFRD